ncbi:uncharacterized protein J3D65DRAFT_356661 [Phyllosticta citribraziliensis]|uniref:Uncharacterized protein n=1 Tax=Phyllosticta citribraziliensis TaxID=989973 RepID=A0ABR1LSY7_9PEZI
MLAKDSYTPPPLPLSLSSRSFLLFGFPNTSEDSLVCFVRGLEPCFRQAGEAGWLRIAPSSSLAQTHVDGMQRDGRRERGGLLRLSVCSLLLSLTFLSFVFLFLIPFISFLSLHLCVVVVFGVHAWHATVSFQFAPDRCSRIDGGGKGWSSTVARKRTSLGMRGSERRRERRRSRDRSGRPKTGWHARKRAAGGASRGKAIEYSITSTSSCAHVTRRD